VREAIARVAGSGVHVVLATGRSPWFGVGELARELGLSGPQIMIQGALVMDPDSGRIERIRTLDPAVVEDAVRFASELGIEPLVGRVDEAPVRVFVSTAPGRHAAVMAEAVERFEGRASIVWSDRTAVEVLPLGTHKGEAVRWFAQRRGIEPHAVAAAGDAPNDTQMLRLVGRSAAMGWAPPDVRAAADITVATSDEDGLVHALAWFFPDLAGSLGSMAALA
jgi:hydroxymethylpyrimidine pyrophosphatase-like HAD family hydrolase